MTENPDGTRFRKLPDSTTANAVTILAIAALVLTMGAAPARAAQRVEPPATHSQAIAAFEAGELEGALRQFEALAIADPNDGWAPFYIGRIAIYNGEWDTAIASLERALELGPVLPEVHRYAGEAYVGKIDTVGIFSKLGWSKKARAAFLLAVELVPDDVESRRMLMEFYIYAPGIAGGGKEKAAEQAEQITSRDPFRGHLAWAEIHQQSEQLDLLRNDLRAAIALRPDDVPLRLRLAIQLHQARRFEEAWRNLDAAIQSSPDHLDVLYQQGRTAALSGRHLEDGAAALERYIELAGESPPLSLAWAWYRLGMVHRHAGDTAAARTAFGEALSLEPDHKEARKALKKLR